MCPANISCDGGLCDVRSEGSTDERRCIEVNGRACSECIVLSGAELDKLCQSGQHTWLYDITCRLTERPCLGIVQDSLLQAES